VTQRQPWPHPGDTELQRARRIAIAYRTHLHTANPTVCDALDDMARTFGEGWVCGQPVTTPDDALVTTADAAELAAVQPETIHKWRRRGIVVDGARLVLEARGLNERGWPLFRASEVLEFAAATRRKRLRRKRLDQAMGWTVPCGAAGGLCPWRARPPVPGVRVSAGSGAVR
jgi:hypothetical protein